MPRRRKVPARLGGGEVHADGDPRALYRRQYYELLDLLIGQLEERFDQPGFLVLQLVERLIESAAAGQASPVPAELRDLYGADLNLPRLETQLKLLTTIVNDDGDCGQNLNGIVQTLQSASESGGEVFRRLMSEVITLVRIYLTVPVSTATAERTFSTLRRTKTYLRTTMGQVRLNSAMLCTTHRERVDQLDVGAIAQQFVAVNDRRRGFFGPM
ncbi:hypothetical protein FJT64_018062 [Amphibalanus amphitrite]|uniref:HAT C-terminal dimerisation domain-containing protein n=1 Tax=Amphibalanus amphitrite TaxID=1232801 RepID=A0A6A4X9J0_AMPAM|nr:hypothetical protein FJT64_005767 [Amphibalanus amphitrite]KAF0311101.1 hypothetical protein FJT64_018062 [Amphibalanus amphitrite]